MNKSVAVIDVRSDEVTAVVAERGVNGTFIIKNKYSCGYEGYAEGAFIDKNSFFDAVAKVVSDTISALGNPVKKFYIGVPGEFTKVLSTDKTISFNSAKKINKNDVDYVCRLSRPDDSQNYINVKSGCIYYTLSDKRRIIDPVGELSDSLQAKLCFYMVRRSFADCIATAFSKVGCTATPSFIPMLHAEAMYLLSPEKRDSLSLLFDFGYISSSFSVVFGNGVAYSESFSIGVGHLAYLLSGELEIPYGAAYALLQKVNLNAKENSDSVVECKSDGRTFSFSSALLREKLRLGLDSVCEMIDECIHAYAGNVTGKTVYITGEGVNVIRGTGEHFSSKLARTVQTAAPKLPYYDKPQYSSLFSLMNAALEDLENTPFFKRK